MAFTKITDDLNIIQALPDEPNEAGGLSAAQLKAKFDEAGNKLKNGVNSLIDELGDYRAASNIGFVSTSGVPEDNVQAAITNVQAQVRDISQGTVADGSITKRKLANDTIRFVGFEYISGSNFGFDEGDNVGSVDNVDAYYCESLQMVRFTMKFTTGSESAAGFSILFAAGNIYPPYEEENVEYSLFGVANAKHGSEPLLANIGMNENGDMEIHVSSMSQIASGETVEVSGMYRTSYYPSETEGS